jgi:hypothetical protein
MNLAALDIFRPRQRALNRRDLNAVLLHMRDEYGLPSVRCNEVEGSFECECHFRQTLIDKFNQNGVHSGYRFDTPLQAAAECLRRIEVLFVEEEEESDEQK